MKGKIFTVLLIVFTIAVSTASILSIDTSEDISNGQRHNSDEYVLDLDYKDDFRILQLCDIHLGTKDNVQEHLDFLSITINESNADLIVLDGDNFTYADKTTAKRLFDFLDSFGVPWTLTLGNHDEQCAFSVDWMTDYLNNYGSNCKFIDIKGDDVFGNANFAINLNKDGQVHDQVILLDSNRYYFGDYIGYDFVKQSQIDWYERLVNDTKNKNGSLVNSLIFMHIPVPEINDAWYAAGGQDAQDAIKKQGGFRDENSKRGIEEHINYEEYTKQFGKDGAVFEYGYAGTDFSPAKYNSGLFDKVLELGSTKAMLFAHDHTYNSRILYKGVYLIYGVNSTDRVIRDNNMMGGHVIVIHDDHSLSFEHIYHTYEDIKHE